MRLSGRTKAVILAVLVVLLGAGLFQGVGQATGGSAPDADDMAAGKIDVSSATHDDDAAFITLGFAAFDNFAGSDLFQAFWELDLNGNGVFGEAQDACISLEQVDGGAILRGTLQTQAGCTNNDATADATRPAANAVQLQFRNADFRSAGLGTGSSYNYKLRVTSASGGHDFVPETSATPIAVTGVVPASTTTPTPTATPTPTPTATPTPVPTPTPTPCTGCQSASAAPQQVSVTVQGVLAIARGLPDTINFGTVTKGANPTAQAAGQLDYTNTLYDDNPPWNVTVQSTNLVRSGGCTLTPASLCTIPYANTTYTPGGTISAASGSSGMPQAASAGAFTGSGTISDPKTVATATQGTYGTFTQTGASLGLSVPLGVRPGAYTGTLTYTVIG